LAFPLTLTALALLPPLTHAQEKPMPQAESPVPDSTGWGTHVLAVAERPDGSVWVGTYGQGIYVSRDGTGKEWQNLRSRDSSDISWDFVNAIAFGEGEVWYGTIGNGWGVSRDGGATWRNWTFDELGPRWLYVAPDGIAVAGDTVFVATADGLRITADGGESWRDVTESEGLRSRYLLDVEVVVDRDGPPTLGVLSLAGYEKSKDAGRTWEPGMGPMTALDRVFADSRPPGFTSTPSSQLVRSIVTWMDRDFRRFPDPGEPVARPGDRDHFWFERPIASDGNRLVDQTYTYGSTMGGNFQQHQGVEFNNPEGTPVHAIGDGVVAFAGPAEAGSNTVAILHDRRLGDRYVWSTYYHNADLAVEVGGRVKAGELIAHVGSTGRATNDHLHLEIHVTPADDVGPVVNPEERFPPYTVHPLLWIRPMPETGVIAGRVLDSAGRPVPGARVYLGAPAGTTGHPPKEEPRETPFSFAETYEDKAHPDPVFDENFVIGDVRAGRYVLGVEIEGQRIYHAVEVEPGRVTEVELRP
jgi:murein DD-endopeptidase MepM/ murein hydrolase activator NlpD